MKLNVRPKTIVQNVLYYMTLGLLAMPWGSRSQLFGHGLAVRVVLIGMVAASFVLSGRGSCRVSAGG
jgi:hypothetical protein